MSNEQQPTPPVMISPWQRLVRTNVHAIAILIIMHLLTPFIGDRPLPHAVFAIASPMAYLPWSMSIAAGLNADRIMTILLALLLLTFAWPDHLKPYLIPVIAGLVVGTGVRHLITEAQR